MGREKIMTEQLSRRIKLDIHAPVEKIGGCLMIAATFMLLFFARSYGISLDGFLMAVGCFLHWILLLKIYRSLRIYYILDLDRKSLVKHADLLGFSRDWGVTLLGDIVGVGVITHRTKRRQVTFHRYSAVIGTSKGKLIEVTNLFGRIEDADLKAKQLAETIGCKHLPGKHREDPKVNLTTNTLEYNPGHDLKDLVTFGKLVALIPLFIFLSTPFFLMVAIPPYIPLIIFRTIVPSKDVNNTSMDLIQPGKGLKGMVQLGEKPDTFLKTLGSPLRLDEKGPKNKPFWRIYYYKGFELHCYDTTGWAVNTIKVTGIFNRNSRKRLRMEDRRSYNLPSKIGISDHYSKLEKLWGKPDITQTNFLYYYQRGLALFIDKHGKILSMTIKPKRTKDGKKLIKGKI